MTATQLQVAQQLTRAHVLVPPHRNGHRLIGGPLRTMRHHYNPLARYQPGELHDPISGRQH